MDKRGEENSSCLTFSGDFLYRISSFWDFEFVLLLLQEEVRGGGKKEKRVRGRTSGREGTGESDESIPFPSAAIHPAKSIICPIDNISILSSFSCLPLPPPLSLSLRKIYTWLRILQTAAFIGKVANRVSLSLCLAHSPLLSLPPSPSLPLPSRYLGWESCKQRLSLGWLQTGSLPITRSVAY